MKLKTLYKQASNGKKVVEWNISVSENPDKTATITTVYGQRGGKKQTVNEVISKGKNIGRSNETTPLQQAEAEAQSRWNVKRTRHNYSDKIATAGEARSKAPMLAHLYEDHSDDVDWENAYVQPKLDGYRCMVECVSTDKIVLRSREGKEIVTMSHIEEALIDILEPGDRLDGELYIHKTPFQKLASLIRRKQDGSELVKYNVYDLPTDAAEHDFDTRLVQLESKLFDLAKGAPVTLVKTEPISSEEELMTIQSKLISKGYEGAMLRHGNAPYEFGKRSKSLLKVKTFKDAEFKIVQTREGRGKCKGMCVFLCETEDGTEFEVFAPGTSEEKKRAWKNRDSYIGKLLTVKYQEMTTSEHPVPRFPVALRIREDL